jgi:gliding motility-associated lipoprotein GldH
MNQILKISIGLLICFISCKPGVINQTELKFEEPYLWMSGDTKELILEVTENSEPCELYLDVRYAEPLLPFDKLNLRIIEIQPGGVSIPRDLTIELRDAAGAILGDVSGDIVDVERLLDGNKQFLRHGKYSYKIDYNLPVEVLGGIMEFRLRTVKKKME